jgi:hypothetical protein
MSDRTFPDFLGIGAQKAGTTWLNTQLKQHPGIWLPPYKELHYFDRSRQRLPEALEYRFSVFERQKLKRLPGRLYREYRRGNLEKCAWYLRYHFLYRSDAWYASLFKQGKGKVKGEITPGYSVLEREDVAAIHALMPDLKLIFLMRDPIERAWSHARMYLGRWQKRNMSSIPEQELVRFFNRDHVVLRSSYLRTLENWGAYYPREQFLVGFLEDIEEQPEKLLLDLFEFLGVDVSRSYIAGKAREKVNRGHRADVPPEVERYMASLYLDQLRELERRVGGHAVRWRERAEGLLQP